MSLPVTANLIGHWDASVLGLSDGATVTSWTDLSGNGNHLASTNSTKGHYQTNSQNSLSGVLFVDAEQNRDDFSGPTEKTIYLVCKNPPNDGTRIYIQQSYSGYMAKEAAADTFAFGHGAGTLSFAETGLVGQPCLWTFVAQNTGAFVRANQAQKVSGNLTLAASTGWELGNQNNGTGDEFTAYECVFYSGVHSSGDIDLVEDYLYDKWFVVAAVTGTGSSTLAGATSAGAGTYTPGAITGTGTATLAGVTSAGSGSFLGAVTGTGAATLAGVTSAGSGTFIGATTGSGSSTLTGATSAGTGTYVPGAITGTGTSTLSGVTSSGVGVLIIPITGTGASTLGGVTSAGVGSFQSTADAENIICDVLRPTVRYVRVVAGRITT